MTAAQRATLERLRVTRQKAADNVNATIGFRTQQGDEYAEEADALRAALGTCGTCAHADDSQAAVGWTWCAAPAQEADCDVFPFRHSAMPLGERCTGYTPKEGA